MTDPAAMRKIDLPYYVFDDHLYDDDQFVQRPKEVILLATLEIVVDDGRGTHMLVVAPRYEAIEAVPGHPSHETAQWTPPYVSTSVSRNRTHVWRSVRIIREAIEQELELWNPELQLERLVRTWSAGIGDLTYKGAFTEYKHSWGSPTVRNIYHVVRYGARTQDADLLALADPECRKGFYYLPLDDEPFGAVVSHRECVPHARDESMFLGRPLATNLAHLVRSPESRRTLRASPQHIPIGDFQQSYRGVLFCGDVASYGAACRYIDHHMASAASDAPDRAMVLRESVTAAFMSLFQEAGIHHVHTAGDGFITAIPAADDDLTDEALGRFFMAYARYIDVVNTFARRIADHAQANGHADGSWPRVGTRLAVHRAGYRYGKIAGAASLISGFDGAGVIDVARFEQGLSTYAKARAHDPGFEHRHLVAASDEIVKALEPLEKDRRLEVLETAEFSSKEFAQPATVFAWT